MCFVGVCSDLWFVADVFGFGLEVFVYIVLIVGFAEFVFLGNAVNSAGIVFLCFRFYSWCLV